jgi:sulfur carrier protein
VRIIVNGRDMDVADDMDIAQLATSLALPERGVAIAVDNTVVPRGTWPETRINTGQHIEILTAVQGG